MAGVNIVTACRKGLVCRGLSAILFIRAHASTLSKTYAGEQRFAGLPVGLRHLTPTSVYFLRILRVGSPLSQTVPGVTERRCVRHFRGPATEPSLSHHGFYRTGADYNADGRGNF
jgi:hypothetical protein